MGFLLAAAFVLPQQEQESRLVQSQQQVLALELFLPVQEQSSQPEPEFERAASVDFLPAAASSSAGSFLPSALCSCQESPAQPLRIEFQLVLELSVRTVPASRRKK